MTQPKDELLSIVEGHGLETCIGGYDEVVESLQRFIHKNYIPREKVDGLKVKATSHFHETEVYINIEDIDQLLKEGG